MPAKQHLLGGKNIFVRAAGLGGVQIATANADEPYGNRPVEIVAVISVPDALRLVADIIANVTPLTHTRRLNDD